MSAVKVLFSGAIEGDLPGLFKKVEAVNKKNGPFEALFCVGQFFGPGDDTAEPNDALVAYVTGEGSIPVPTYFIGGFGAGSSTILTALPAAKAPLKYLGRSGVTTINGLNVAFLDGVYNHPVFTGKAPQPPPAPTPGGRDSASCPHYTKDDVALLKSQLQALQGEVDVLLTCEWPRGLTTGIQGPLPEGYRPASSGSNVVSELVALARPRYHIAGGEALHYARPPFSHRDLGAGIRVTRFVGLAPAGHPGKAKSLHALGLVPAAVMEPESLSLAPEGCAPSPFELRQAKREQEEMAAGGEFNRWQQQPGAKKQRRDGGGGGAGGPGPQALAGRPDVPRDPVCTVAVRNVPWVASEEDIAAFFGQAGQVVNVWRGTNKTDGRVQGVTQVQFASREEAERALQLHNCDFNGRQVAVEPSRAGTSNAGRRTGEGGAGGGGGDGKPVDGCWFCLGSVAADTELVASVGEEVYLAVDKGPITSEHVLLVPIDHHPASVALSPTCFAEMERYLSALRSMFASLGRELVAFERHLSLRSKGGNHCHINVIGVPPAAAARAGEAFRAAAARAGFPQLELLPPPTRGSGPEELQRALLQAVGGEPDTEYFLALLPDGSRLVRPLARGERWPMALGREVFAELAGVPERASWKQCSSSPEEERQRVDRFKQLFKPYDVMAGEGGEGGEAGAMEADGAGEGVR
ncbi:hypothetical protein PLESTB_000695700 [Pleodorina starrii]|uniref:RRM domain-containing protein n=1 Tax=Pleodorina starrii TaxID=330485 RepID=A0A9W6BKA8_9CHLO|nr:hypothetical protein PLESTM_001221300 [Pleodorina starrii]GLC52986.1 hypothetical protein PLESTB_000695700 [Pleodorina starrii]GLC65283.1 hypothetical protein PLESTF_000272100 [Pleodorina starrii]